ncbi:MAG: flagellar M-ring protein FliF, partial [bacterium]|nr:flagellar M-ring protein FliF [bacterium]
MKMTNQIGQIIKSQSAARRLLLLAIVMGSVCAMVALTLHTRTGGYVVLFTGMQAGDAGEAIGKLRQMGIEARLENGGTTIKVPRNRSDEAAMMMAMEGIPSSGIVGFELMDKNSLGQTKFQQEKNYLRMREGELARTLLSLREIERARVHLALPENVLFAQDSERPTASVVIKLHNGAALTDKQVSGIIHLVSHSVEGLQPEDVSIIDNLGNLLNESRLPEGATLTLTQNNFKTQYEDLLKSRIETMLEKVVGKGKVAARVQADFDFSTSREVKEIYNPDDQDPIKVSERTQTEVDKSPGSAVAVTPPPTATPAAAQGTVPAGATNSQLTTEYAVSKMKQRKQ